MGGVIRLVETKQMTIPTTRTGIRIERRIRFRKGPAASFFTARAPEGLKIPRGLPRGIFTERMIVDLSFARKPRRPPGRNLRLAPTSGGEGARYRGSKPWGCSHHFSWIDNFFFPVLPLYQNGIVTHLSTLVIHLEASDNGNRVQ